MSNNKSRSSKPYDSSNSFVKKVASRVSGLIPRSTSWLSGWFSPTTGSEQGSSSRQEEITNEGEQFEDALSVEQPPPSKRLKLSANPPQFVGAFPRCQTGDQGENSSRHVPNNFIDTSAIPGTSGQGMRSGGFVASTPAVTSVEHLEPKANGDDCSESGESTSGCSSLEPQINRGLPNTQSQTRQIESMSPRKRLHEDKLNYSYLQSSRSLFLDHTSNSHNKTVGRRNNPSFCVNTFGTPLFGGRGNVNDLILNSPFYAGRTTYGGASSASYRRSLGSASLSSSPANSEKLARHTIKVKPGNSHVAEDTSMSQTAKRILATLEQFSTPILDAKRIPVNQQPALSSLGSRKRSRLNEAQHSLEQPQIPKRCLNKPLHWAKGAPNTSQLTIPLTPDTLIHRRRELVHDSTPAISPAGSIADNYKLRTEADNNLTTRNTLKMKPRITDKDPKEPELGIEVHLPEVPLPISSLPVLDISVPAPKDVSKITPGSALLSGISSMNKPLASSGNLPATLSSFSTSPSKSNAEGTFSDASFSFSSPIKVSAEVKDRPVSSMNSFTFSKPLPASLKFAEPSANSMKARPKASSDNPSPKVEFPCGLKPASELKTGSVMDILGKGTTNTSKSISSSANGTISPMDKLKPAAGTWECNKCLIRNKSDQAKCACEDPREENTKLLSTDSSESKMSSTSPNLKKDADFGAQFKMSQGMWECSACMLRNKDADSKCVACTTPKPSAAPPKTASSAAILSSWGDKFKPPSGTWECNVCMVRNGPELSACQSCTTQKPGASSESSAPVSVKSSWGDQFKKPEGSWTCSECMITNKAADTKCVACMTKKPGAPPSPKQGLQFSFGVPPGNSSETNTPATTSFSIVPKTTKEGNDSDKSSVSSSTGFKFGESKSETPTVTFSFGIPQSSTLTVPTSTNSLVPASDSLPRAIPISSPPSMNSCLFGVKVADVTPPPSVVITNDSKTTPTFGAAVALEEKSNAVPLFSFSKPPESSVLSQPASSTVSPLGGKRKFGGDASSSSSPPIKFGIATDQASLVKPEVTTMSSVSSTSGSVFSPSSASSVCNPAVTALSGTVTSSASSQTTVEVVKTSSSSPFLGASPTAAPTPKLVVTFGLNAAAKDESVTSTWKPAVSNNTVDDQKLSTDNGVGAPKGGFSFGSTVSSSGMAFGSSTIPGTATFSFGASTDKTATPNKTIAFGTPASSTTLFGSGIGNLAGSAPSFGTPSGTGFGSLTSSSNTSQGFPASNSITSSFTSPPSSAFPSSFGSTSEEKKPMFSFGTATEPKKSGYFFSPPDEKKPFSFGSAAGTAATTTQNAFSAASSGVFTFGSSAPAANGPEKVDFALGANQSSTFPNFTSQQSTTGGFSYIGASPSFGSGANSTPTVTTPFAGATSPAAFAASTSFSSAFTPANSQPTGFNFSTSGANSFGTQNPSPFSFGNGADKPTFNFNAGGPTALPTTSDTTGSTVPPRRAYLKAARRNKPTMR